MLQNLKYCQSYYELSELTVKYQWDNTAIVNKRILFRIVKNIRYFEF